MMMGNLGSILSRSPAFVRSEKVSPLAPENMATITGARGLHGPGSTRQRCDICWPSGTERMSTQSRDIYTLIMQSQT
jgi:hypothetical protein